MLTHAQAGHWIMCVRCDGHGIIQSWPNIPDECPDCGGGGKNWQYPSGVIAKYPSGPFIGRAAYSLREQVEPATRQCATEGCENPGTEHFEYGGGSYHCPDCMAKIESRFGLDASPPDDTVRDGADWQIEAFDETLALARQRHMGGFSGGLELDHLADMRSRIEPGFSRAKIGRWLGWAQAACCAAGVLSLDEAKAINKRCSEDARAALAKDRDNE